MRVQQNLLEIESSRSGSEGTFSKFPVLTNITVSMAKFENPNPGDFYLFTGNPISAATTAVVEAMITTFPTEYLYLSQRLWTIYGISLRIVLAAVISGGVMFAVNGIDADLSFSQVLVTTRNETLDRLSRGCNLGGWTISHELMKTKVRFGEVMAEDPEMSDVGHASFGLEKKNRFSMIDIENNRLGGGLTYMLNLVKLASP